MNTHQVYELKEKVEDLYKRIMGKAEISQLEQKEFYEFSNTVKCLIPHMDIIEGEDSVFIDNVAALRDALDAELSNRRPIITDL